MEFLFWSFLFGVQCLCTTSGIFFSRFGFFFSSMILFKAFFVPSLWCSPSSVPIIQRLGLLMASQSPHAFYSYFLSNVSLTRTVWPISFSLFSESISYTFHSIGVAYHWGFYFAFYWVFILPSFQFGFCSAILSQLS